MGTRSRRLGRVAKVGLPAFGLAAAMTAAGAGQGIALADPATTTPIKHVVVIFGENISFDHYFATYPNATNPVGEPQFTPAAGTAGTAGSTQTINNLQSANLLSPHNPNSSQPFRFDNTSKDVMTCSQNHSYTPEQLAFDNGAMDKFVQNVGSTGFGVTGRICSASDNLGYYDGNTVTAMWNYAQHGALDDNNFGTVFGPSTPGAINVTSGETGSVDATHYWAGAGATGTAASNSNLVPNGQGGYSMTGDIRPYYDDCNTSAAVAMSGKNIGDLLNSAGLSWGWFQGGFKPTTAATTTSDPTGAYNPATETGKAACNTSHQEGAAAYPATALDPTTHQPIAGGAPTTTADYIQHHEPFQFYPSTANPHHIAPTSLNAIGTDTQDYNSSGQPTFDTANHNYDMSDFDSLVSAIAHGTVTADHLPAVSYLKAPAYEDGHAGYSDPLDEQAFVTKEINALEQTPDWSSTAVILAYDDSDGWYDHVEASGFPNHTSQTSEDAVTGTNQCGTATPADGEQGKCGYGPRTPLLIISPYAKANFIDHTETNQASVVKFIEDNFLGSQRITNSADATSGSLLNMFNFNQTPNATLYLDPATGEPTATPVPNLPESHLAVELLASGGAVLVFGAAFLARRRRRGSALAL